MSNFHILSNKSKLDPNMYVYQIGMEECLPNHSYGPAVRDHYLLHFIKKGQGLFHKGDHIYHLKENDIFLIKPHEITYYQAHDSDPWHYMWLGINGAKAKYYLEQIGFTEDKPYINVKSFDLITEYLTKMYQGSKQLKGSHEKMHGYLFLFISTLLEDCSGSTEKSTNSEYVNKAIEYVEMHFTRSISVNEISDMLSLNRSYFSTIFKSTTGLSPQHYIIQYRINKACELMEMNPSISIGDVARSVGYEDQLTFSKVFKRIIGISPTNFKSNHLTT